MRFVQLLSLLYLYFNGRIVHFTYIIISSEIFQMVTSYSLYFWKTRLPSVPHRRPRFSSIQRQQRLQSLTSSSRSRPRRPDIAIHEGVRMIPILLVFASSFVVI